MSHRARYGIRASAAHSPISWVGVRWAARLHQHRIVRTLNQDAYSSGFLGPRMQPLMVGASDMPGTIANGTDGFPQLRVQGLTRPDHITDERMESGWGCGRTCRRDFCRLTARRSHRSQLDLPERGATDEQRGRQGIRPVAGADRAAGFVWTDHFWTRVSAGPAIDRAWRLVCRGHSRRRSGLGHSYRQLQMRSARCRQNSTPAGGP